MKLPTSRTENIVVQETNQELLIYDLLTNQALCLNQTSAIVFNACHGIVTVDELKRQTNLTDEIIFLTLDELNKHNLLSEQYHSPWIGMSRREIIKKVVLSTMLALPTVMSIIAPTAAQAASGSCPNPTTQPSPGTCQSSGFFRVGCVSVEECTILIRTTTSCCRGVDSGLYAFDGPGPYCQIGCISNPPGGGID